MEIPVYFFTGFLESGKTSFIHSILKDPNFSEGERTLLLVCEDGEVEYDYDLLRDTNWKFDACARQEGRRALPASLADLPLVKSRMMKENACGPFSLSVA